MRHRVLAFVSSQSQNYYITYRAILGQGSKGLRPSRVAFSFHEKVALFTVYNIDEFEKALETVRFNTAVLRIVFLFAMAACSRRVYIKYGGVPTPQIFVDVEARDSIDQLKAKIRLRLDRWPVLFREGIPLVGGTVGGADLQDGTILSAWFEPLPPPDPTPGAAAIVPRCPRPASGSEASGARWRASGTRPWAGGVVV